MFLCIILQFNQLGKQLRQKYNADLNMIISLKLPDLPFLSWDPVCFLGIFVAYCKIFILLTGTPI